MIASRNPSIGKAQAFLVSIPKDELEWMREESYRRAEDQKQAEINDARVEGIERGMEKGIEKGMEKGREEERKAMICNMISNLVPYATISNVTGLSLDEIVALRNG